MAHGNTIFHQMLKLIPKHHFAKLEAEHSTGRPSRTFSRWHQPVHLIFIEVTSRASLRDGIASLKARLKSLYHLGVRPVARSTFADANNRRPAAIFAHLYQRCLAHAPRHKFKFKNKLHSLDATTVSLCLTLFPWASLRRARAGVKLHNLLDHDGYLPAFVSINPAREHEIQKARALNLPQGSLVVEDLGYTDYAWYGQLTVQKIFLVTRQKSNTRYRVLARRPVNTKLGLVADETIELAGAQGRECPKPLRRIVYQDLGTEKVYVFLSNPFRLSAKTIADISQERWQIEIFFRFIKQNLKIKAFRGNSENAGPSQIYAALIVYLLLCYTKFLCNLNVALQHFMRVVQLNLFRTCSGWELFEPPGPPPDNININNQLCLAWA
jgi:hypothetical protein